MGNQKGFGTVAILIGAAVLVIAAILGGTLYVTTQNQTSTPTETDGTYREVNQNFAVDKDHVYIIGGMGKGSSILQDADPKTFVKIDALSAKDANHTYELDAKGYLVIDSQSTHHVDFSDVAVENPSQTQTYTNAQYGFSIDFPKDDPAKTVDYGSSHPFDSKPIVYSGYWITVNVSSKASDVANCTTAGVIHNFDEFSNSILDSTYSKTINGINFAVSDRHDGQPSYERNYTTLRNGMCFDIQIITVPSCALCTSGRPTLESYKPQLDAMDKIAQTFKFIDPSQVVKPTVHVDGMSKYTESSFGYTFWYPNTWTVSEVGVQNPIKYGGGTVRKTLKISNGAQAVYIDQFHSNGRSIEDINSVATYDFVDDVLYFFDPNSHTWMVNFPNGHSVGNPNSRTWTDANPQKTTRNSVTANVSSNTMGGLHIFEGANQTPSPIANEIIPLSASNYLVVYTSAAAGPNDYFGLLYGLIQTIGATDASVATPVSEYDQINAIQDEKNAYAN